MRSYNTNVKHINPFIVLNVSVYILAAICFMIYTTQQSYTFAEGDKDLGYDISSVDASVTVGTACTFTGAITSPHTATIANGINSTDIGTTILNTKCNDSGGYALYAIGYTNDEYGTTDLSSSISTTYNIPTGTSTTGNTSSWSMKLNQVSGTTTATIENGYNNYNIVPDDYTKVATLNTITDNTSTSSVTGSSISTTYQTYISPTQPAGTYTGKVKYTLVHPSTSPQPIIPDISELTYMQDLARIGESDMTALKKSMPEGQQYILKDNRDGKDYYISKLADGNIWMTQNLDLNIEAGKTYTSADTDLANSSIDTSWTPSVSTSSTSSWVSSYTDPSSYDPGNLYWDGTLNTNWDGYLHNETVDNPAATSGGVHYHIGNYYNWTAAIAMNSSVDKNSGDMNQSICPAGWRLPTYSGDKSYQNLVNMEGLTAGTSGNIQNAPTYFVYSGNWASYSRYVGSSGDYWSSAVANVFSAYRLDFGVNNNLNPQDSYGRNYGYSVRCVAR